MDANPRNVGNPDADEFTKRHDQFYRFLVAQNESSAKWAFKALRAWAYARCRMNSGFMEKYESLTKDKRELTLADMDLLATEMKCVWQEQGLWDYSRPPVSEQT